MTIMSQQRARKITRLSLRRVRKMTAVSSKRDRKNPAYGRHRISRLMRIVAPIFLFPLASKKGLIAIHLVA